MLKTLAIGVVMCAAWTAWAEEYHDATRRWSVQVPPGWARIGDTEITQLDQAASGGGKIEKSFAFITGFTKNLKEPFSGPYVIVQFSPGEFSKANYDDMEKALNAVDSKAVAAEVSEKAGPGREATMGRMVLDRATGRTHFSVQINDAKNDRVVGECTGFLGMKGIVQLNCYAREKVYPDHAAEFKQMIESFRYDAGAEFVPFVETKSTWSSGQKIGLTLAVGVAVFVAIAEVARKKKAA